jgi:hypothetical protein
VTAAQNRFAIAKLDRWPIHDNSEEFDEVDHHLLTSLRPDLWNCEMSTFNRVAETEIFDLSFFERPLLAQGGPSAERQSPLRAMNRQSVIGFRVPVGRQKLRSPLQSGERRTRDRTVLPAGFPSPGIEEIAAVDMNGTG